MKVQAQNRDQVRQPRQERSRYKVQLILEATLRLLEKGSIEQLTTNAVAASAGVSIGTLYQFFPNKEAILDTLADQEIAQMSDNVMRVLEDPAVPSAEARVAAVVDAIAASYGQRQRAHRLVMVHSLTRGSSRLAPLMAKLMTFLSAERQHGQYRKPIGAADAFVLAHSFAGTLRAMIEQGEKAPPRAEIAQVLARMVMSFFR